MVCAPWVTVKAGCISVLGMATVQLPAVPLMSWAVKLTVRDAASYFKFSIAELPDTAIVPDPDAIVCVWVVCMTGRVAPEFLSGEPK
jgi:hypothetical protein